MATMFDADVAVRIIKGKTGYHAHIEGSSLHGSGDTPEAALADLSIRYEQFRTFSDETGIPLSMMSVPLPTPVKRSAWRTAALVLVCCGLLMVPLSYALSTAIERSFQNLDLKGGRQFWSALEEGLITAADPKNAPDPDRQARTVEALRTLVARIKPYTDAVKPLFQEQSPPDPSRK